MLNVADEMSIQLNRLCYLLVPMSFKVFNVLVANLKTTVLLRLLRSCELTVEATGNIVSSVFEEAGCSPWRSVPFPRNH